MKKTMVLSAVLAALTGCSSILVRQSDLDSWPGMPVEALDMHSLFITVPMYRTMTESGIEIRNYANGSDSESCYSSGSGSKNGKYLSASSFTNCTSNKVVCNNIFYIKNGKVLEYAPTGQCYTDETVRPQRRYLDLMKQAG